MKGVVAVAGALRAGVLGLLLGAIAVYRALSAARAPRCRFTPTCSAYAAEALRRHGIVRGVVMAARRLLRCHPWGGAGYDPP